MSKLTKEFVEGFLERYDGDLSGPILDLADGGNPLHALLEGLDRKDIIEWLQEEFDGLLMHGFEPAQDIDLPERKNSELLLAFLEKTKPENSRGLQFEIEAVGDPEEGYTPEKYIQAYEVSIRYEGTGLGTCALESEGAYISGKWVAESAQWPTLLQGVVPLPTVVIQEPQHQRQEVDRIEKLETGLKPADVAAIYSAYDRLKARQGNLNAVSIGKIAKESGVPMPRLQQFLLTLAARDRADLHPTTLVRLSPEDKAGATAVPGMSEPAITVTIRGMQTREQKEPPTVYPGFEPVNLATQEPEPEPAPEAESADAAAIYSAYDRLKARQGGLSAVSIGELAKESGVPVPRVQQFLLSEARQDRVDLHATSLVWHSLSPEDKAGATAVPGRSEPAITATIRQKLATAALPAGLDIIKAYDDIVDGAEARKRLEQTNPSLVAARDKAITELRGEKLQKETAERQHKVARVRSR